jgi:group I intron endonuclease
MGYIYILKSPSGKIYIGQTIRYIHKRLERHQQKGNKCRAIYGAINKYGWENFEIDWYECPDNQLNKHERWMVKLMGTLSPDGYNLKEGGGNGKLSEETKQKLREANLGKILSKETKQKMSESTKGEKNPMFGKTGELSPMFGKTGDKHHRFGKKDSKETKHQKSIARTGEKNPQFGMTGDLSPTSKKIYQYDLNGVYINCFGSLREAARSLDKTDHSNISRCASGTKKYAYGFIWSYDQHEY